jgi:large subunit ribosomal protein L21
MYAIVVTGGKQYKVAEGDIIDVEKLEAEEGQTVSFEQVLFLNNGEAAVTDPEALAKVVVEGEVLKQYRDKKVIVFKFRRRKRYQRTRGHRQYLTKVRITKVVAE